MFKREVQVKFAKAKKSEDENAEEDTFDQRIDKVTKAANKIIGEVIVGVCAYVILDTYRQILINNNRPEPDSQ